ncbi:MAG: winged helix DNA-binding domain-containing protein [bacterium]
MTRMSTADLLAARMAASGLTHRPASDPAGAARVCAGIQAQDLWATRLAVRSRSATARLDDVLAAVQGPPAVVRTWPMRGTLHLLPAEDVRWTVGLTGPSVLRMTAGRRRGLGLDDDLLARVGDALPKILTGRILTGAEIIAELGRLGITFGPDPGAAAHIIFWAAVSGLVCRGPERGSHRTVVLLDDWVPTGGPTGEDALVELARRYVQAFGPVTPHDFASWSGLTIGAGRRAFAALADELETVTVEDQAMVRLDPVPAARGVLRLLAAFDTYLMGYRPRDAMLHPSLQKRIVDGGMLYPSICLDGALLGRWSLNRATDPASVTLGFFHEPPPHWRDLIDGEVADIARFLDRDVRLAEPTPIAAPKPS